MQLVLASSSPRRQVLLSVLTNDFICRKPELDETAFAGEAASSYVVRLAREKAHSIRDAGSLSLGADTAVVVDGDILGKPANRPEARAMLERLSGRSHEVFTAIATWNGRELMSSIVSTEVTMMELSPSLIETYLDTDEPWDKAGAYAIQGIAGSFIPAIRGSYSGVVGLPLCETRDLLRAAGLTLQHD